MTGGHEIQEGDKSGRVSKKGHLTDISQLKHCFYNKTKTGI